ncbi:MAG: hypothetical protein RL095_3479 [Verrucomicrobiota bacterium]|jgi:drug/metabolite transporter (DMT)-like permease
MNPIAILVFVTVVWGSTFPILKELSQAPGLDGMAISALRFFIAALCLAPLAARIPAATWKAGGVLAILAFISYVSQAWGLSYISSNRSAFITSVSVLLVPLIGCLLGRFPGPKLIAAAALALGGLGFMSWEGGGDLRGDSLTFLCALCNAFYIIALSKIAAGHKPMHLAASQVFLMAALALPALAGTGRSPAQLLEAASGSWPALIYLGAVATAAMLALQSLAQIRVRAEDAALIFALEPVFAAAIAYFWIGETLGPRALFGGFLVVAAVIWAERNSRPAESTPPS